MSVASTPMYEGPRCIRVGAGPRHGSVRALDFPLNRGGSFP